MKLTNQSIINFANLNLAERKLPIKLAYALSVNIVSAGPAIEGYSKQRMELLKKHAKKDDKGGLIIKDDTYVFEDIEGWTKDISELLEAEAEVNVTTVPVDVLEKIDNPEFDNLSIRELSILNFMIED